MTNGKITEHEKTLSPRLVSMSKLLLKSANKEPWRNINWVRDEGTRLVMTNGHYLISTEEPGDKHDPKYVLAGDFKNVDNDMAQTVQFTVKGDPIRVTVNNGITDYPDLTIDSLSPDCDEGYTKVKLDTQYLRDILSVIEREEFTGGGYRKTITIAIKGDADPVKLFGLFGDKTDYAILMPIRSK